MFLIDSNIIICALSPDHQNVRDFLRGKQVACSVISKIEVLGFSKLSKVEIEGFQKFFEVIPIFHLTEKVTEASIRLRQKQKMTLGDSIIAATALVNSSELVTANTKDFEWIIELKLLNPLIKSI